MFEFFDGKIIELTPTAVVIQAGQVGYFLHISLNTFSQLQGKPEARVFAHLVVKEDAHELYGFAQSGERDFFRLLISVSGVGPNTARMVLSSLEPEEVRRAIAQGDIGPLKAIKGIGPKTAQRIIIDLQDKMGKTTPITDNMPFKYNTIRDEAFSALLVLGFSRPAVEKAIDSVVSKEAGIRVEDLIKKALKQL